MGDFHNIFKNLRMQNHESLIEEFMIKISGNVSDLSTINSSLCYFLWLW